MDNCGLCGTARFVPVPIPYMTADACQKLLDSVNAIHVPKQMVTCPLCQGGGNDKKLSLGDYVRLHCLSEPHRQLTATCVFMWLVWMGYTQDIAIEMMNSDIIPGLSAHDIDIRWMAFYTDAKSPERAAEIARIRRKIHGSRVAKAIADMPCVDRAKLEEIPF